MITEFSPKLFFNSPFFEKRSIYADGPELSTHTEGEEQDRESLEGERDRLRQEMEKIQEAAVMQKVAANLRKTETIADWDDSNTFASDENGVYVDSQDWFEWDGRKILSEEELQEMGLTHKRAEQILEDNEDKVRAMFRGTEHGVDLSGVENLPEIKSRLRQLHEEAEKRSEPEQTLSEKDETKASQLSPEQEDQIKLRHIFWNYGWIDKEEALDYFKNISYMVDLLDDMAKAVQKKRDGMQLNKHELFYQKLYGRSNLALAMPTLPTMMREFTASGKPDTHFLFLMSSHGQAFFKSLEEFINRYGQNVENALEASNLAHRDLPPDIWDPLKIKDTLNRIARIETFDAINHGYQYKYRDQNNP